MSQGFKFPEAVHVTVTDTHICNGDMGDGRACPIAHAIQDGGTFPAQDYRAYVCRRHVEIRSAHNDRVLQVYYLPDYAERFIQAFDDHGAAQVQPFDFHLQRAGLTDAEEAAL